MTSWKQNLWKYGISQDILKEQDAYLPKLSIPEQIVPEILAQLGSDDYIQILLNLTWNLYVGLLVVVLSEYPDKSRNFTKLIFFYDITL